MVSNARKGQPVKKYTYFPEEIVLGVLENLPSKSLLRFRCVSKQWSRWISEGKSRKKLLVVSKDSEKRHSFEAIDQTLAQLEVINAPPSWADANSDVDIHGSCNGLLLIRTDADLYLWNPSIRWYSHLSFYDADDDYYVAIAGLCYDSNINEYKAVLAWEHKFSDDGARIEVYSVEHIYGKEIYEFPYHVGGGKSGPAMNDRLHWVVSTTDQYFAPQRIVYFNAKTDKFRKFPMPDAHKGKERNRILGLGVLDGCLSMVQCEGDARYHGPVQVMCMKEYGVKESWTILFRIRDISYGGEVVSCFYTAKGSAGITMKRNSSEHGYSLMYKTNEASFTKDITPLLKDGNAIEYEETFVNRDDGITY